MAETKTLEVGKPEKDRKVSLILIGILDIVLGLLTALMVPLMGLALLAPKATNPSAQLSSGGIFGVMALYGSIAAAFISLGIGLCLCRRWARAIMLSLCAMGLVVGVIVVGIMMFIMPGILEKISQQGQIDATTAAAVKWILLIAMGGIYIVLPGIHVLVLAHRNVRDTCLYRDPKTRWTDAVPLQVLPLVFLCFTASAGILFSLSFGAVLPFFGTFLEGPPAVAAVVLLSGLLLWLTREIYRLRMRGWWIGMGLLILWAISSTLTFSRHSVMEIYEKMNITPLQLEQIRQMNFFEGNSFMWLTLAMTLPYTGYLLYCRNYFKQHSS